jgi:hypothetical protein
VTGGRRILRNGNKLLVIASLVSVAYDTVAVTTGYSVIN